MRQRWEGEGQGSGDAYTAQTAPVFPCRSTNLAERVLAVDRRRGHGRDLLYRDLATRLCVHARDYDAIRALAQNVIVQVKDATVIDSPAIQTLHFGAQLQYVSERADVRENGEACGHDIGAVHTACAQPAGGAHQPVGCSSRPLPSGCATANFSGKQTVKFGR